MVEDALPGSGEGHPSSMGGLELQEVLETSVMSHLWCLFCVHRNTGAVSVLGTLKQCLGLSWRDKQFVSLVAGRCFCPCVQECSLPWAGSRYQVSVVMGRSILVTCVSLVVVPPS